ncbi:substrate-binding domain-containing protein [Hoyosella sp. YIM 151337]|uniref:sugar ABC transporter substrate-binding protein n=1 Tax=Hoyosella sp. YIM 151337 TaxID=2992742 RepID=UPI002235E836|nr:substrate-binding domain-containing protein [Hoyosella sp. YIM 151337]MCW4354075.1 substrate-binding domain-containing protein [Hoyosella sp. YIM 151337]
MMRATTGIATVAALTASLALTACGSEGGTTDGTTASGADGESITIGFSQRRLAGSDWWATLLQGAEDKAAELGAEIIVTDAGGDTVKQNSDVQTLLTRGVDAIILNPHDPTGVAGAVTSTVRDDVPLVVVNGSLSDELAPHQFCYVAEDQVAVAARLGAAIAEKATERWGDRPVTAVVIGGYSGETITNLRHKGVIEGYESVEDAPEITYLPIRYGEWLPDRALTPMRDVATANPDIDIVFSLSDVMLPGIERGLQDAGVLDQVLIGTYDGQMAVLRKMMENPDGPVQVNASNEPYKQGETAVEMAVAAARGESQEEVCPGGEFFIETFLATPENAEEHHDPHRQF